MRKRVHFWGVILLSLVALFVAVEGQGRPLSVNDRKRIQCAKEKMYILSNFFDPAVPVGSKKYKRSPMCTGDKEVPPVTVPKWFAEQFPEMNGNKVVYVPGEGTSSEADLWRQAFANVNLFLDLAERSLDPRQPLVLDQLARQYVGIRNHFVLSLDRLNKDLLRGNKMLVMKDSMDGRARSMLSTFELINSEMFSTIESLAAPVSQREDKYRQSVMAIVILSNHLYAQFNSEPIPSLQRKEVGPNKFIYYLVEPEKQKETRADRAINSFYLALGAALAGLAVFLLLENKRDSWAVMMADYRQKSSIWAEDFNRQFLTIDVKYIVLGTILVFALGGALLGWMVGGFAGVFVFLLIVLMGGIVGIRMPMAVLDVLKKSRGRKINAQLMDALILLSNSLRSGMDMVQGFELVTRDMRPPISDEFGLVVKNYQLGTPFEKALDGLTERVESRMLSYIVKAIIIQRQVGGNVTVIFSRLVENIREESKLEEKLQAMTAQQKLQSIVVSVMPFVMMFVMFVFNPSQMISFYTSSVGICVLMFCIIWIGIGMKVLKKMGDIQV